MEACASGWWGVKVGQKRSTNCKNGQKVRIYWTCQNVRLDVKAKLKAAGNKISFPTVYGERQVNVVDKYVHLGMNTTADCSHKAEITVRRRVCNEALGPIATQCFSIAEIPVQKKVNITLAYVFSKFLFGAGSWCKLTKAEESALTSTIMHTWRRTTNSTFKERADKALLPMSDEQVVQKIELMCPLTLVRLLRINLFIRVACSNNATVKIAIYGARKSQKSWLQAVKQDFEWLHTVARQNNSKELEGLNSLPAFVRDVRRRPVFWKKTAKQLCSSPAANVMACNKEDLGADIGPVFSCHACSFVSSSSQQVALHCFTKHGMIKPARMYLDELNVCPTCLRKYPSRTQAVKHMTCVQACSGFMDFVERQPPEVFNALDQAEATRVQSYKSGGTTDACAPRHLQTVQGPLRKQHIKSFKRRWCEKEGQAEFTMCPADHFAACDFGALSVKIKTATEVVASKKESHSSLIKADFGTFRIVGTTGATVHIWSSKVK